MLLSVFLGVLKILEGGKTWKIMSEKEQASNLKVESLQHAEAILEAIVTERK